MATEIERKFLVDKDKWKTSFADSHSAIRQGYLTSDPDKTVRIRISGYDGFITIKSKTKGISRSEYEYKIPVKDAEEMLNSLCSEVISKTRYFVHINNHTWEVDVFAEKNEGLIVAEIELESEDETFLKPEWAGEEVSSDFRYSNSNLARNPYTQW
jgi:adenylate cyclase